MGPELPTIVLVRPVEPPHVRRHGPGRVGGCPVVSFTIMVSIPRVPGTRRVRYRRVNIGEDYRNLV